MAVVSVAVVSEAPMSEGVKTKCGTRLQNLIKKEDSCVKKNQCLFIFDILAEWLSASLTSICRISYFAYVEAPLRLYSLTPIRNLPLPGEYEFHLCKISPS